MSLPALIAKKCDSTQIFFGTNLANFLPDGAFYSDCSPQSFTIETSIFNRMRLLVSDSAARPTFLFHDYAQHR